MTNKLKKTNIAANVFKSACYYATLDHQKWWSNGHFAIKEDFLTKRTIRTINTYNVKNYQDELNRIYEPLKRNRYDTLFLHSTSAKCEKLDINLYLKYMEDGNTSYIGIQSKYMSAYYAYLWQKKDDHIIVQKNGDEINYIVMPYKFDDQELSILQNNIKNKLKNRFIALLEE